jgi:putative ABC transport system permease protein
MLRLALRMLTRDTGKFIALVVGLTFATLLICQQGAIFLGLILRSTGVLQNVATPDLWVVDPDLRFIDEVRALADRDLERVKAVPGVAWVEPLFQSRATVELPDGSYKTAQLVGVDRSTMIGRPPVITAGSLDALRAPDAVMVDESSRSKLANCNIGDTLRLNDKRAIVVGYCQIKLGFQSNAVLYTTFDNAIRFTPVGRERITYGLVKVQDGRAIADVASDITRRTGLAALTREQLAWRSISYILRETGIGINFGITVLLGFVVGLAVTAAIFYQFTLENLRHFAVFKALGAGNRILVLMVLSQALTVGAIGFWIGAGLTGIFSLQGRRPGAELSPFFPWQLLLVCAVGMFICICFGSLLSIRRVVTLEPGIVFK